MQKQLFLLCSMINLFVDCKKDKKKGKKEKKEKEEEKECLDEEYCK